MFQSIRHFIGEITRILPEASVYLTGSAAMGDYREGWSDIDLLVINPGEIPEDGAEYLVNLRQTMTGKEPENPYYRLIEGAVVSLTCYLTGIGTAVSWGSTGQRIREGYHRDVFSDAAMESWMLLYGEDIREMLPTPTPESLVSAVKFHCQTVREYAAKTKHPRYRCGWMLDIARCLYTLKTGRVCGKTKAGEIALRMNWCPQDEMLQKALAVRYDPLHVEHHIPDEAILGFNRVLEDELNRPMGCCCRERGLEFCLDCDTPCDTYLHYVKTMVNQGGLYEGTN